MKTTSPAKEAGKARSDAAPAAEKAPNFVRDIVALDVQQGKHGGRVMTRFPPEPNGFLHIGHAKSICLNFGIASEFGGLCNLRFDDTNPSTEETRYVESIQEDVRWLGFDWGDRRYYASDYFQKLHDFAVELIRRGKAYVDSSSVDEIRKLRGNFYEKGQESPHRARTIDENLALFARMKAGELPDGSNVLRAKIDMASPNLNMRDPPIYRIKKAHHHRSGDAWPIYPMYDFAHCLSDAIEGVTHSICTLEFEDHRPLYDWVLDELGTENHPQQIEFARLNLTYTVLSKRKLLELVTGEHVDGWDDPRMPTLAGLRRRGYSPAAIRGFCDRIGVARRDNVVDVALLEHALRDDLNATSPRALAVLRPLRVVIENYPEDADWSIEAPYHPDDASHGARALPFSRVVYIERDDFMESPTGKWFRLAPGREVRLRYACLITCTGVVKDEQGEVVELRCTWDEASRGGNAPDGRKVKGTLHWVSAERSVEAEVRLYDRLFTKENPSEGEGDFKDSLNPASLEVLRGARVEASLAHAKALSRWQFERLGYFCADASGTPGRPVFNRTITLRDSFGG